MRTRFASLVRLLVAGAWSQNRGRLVLSITAIALGVALAAAVHLINFSAATEFTAAVRGLSGDADVTIRGPRSGFSEDLYPLLARRPEVAVASPILELDAKLVEPAGTLRIQGIDPFRALMLRPGLLGDAMGQLRELLLPGSIMLSTSAAHQLDAAAGDTLRVQAGLRVMTLRVVAVLPLNDALRQPLGLMDIASAQWAFDQLGMVSRIDLRLKPRAQPAALIDTLNAALPAGVIATETAMLAQPGLALSRAYRVNLNMLALVSLFTGAVLVFSTQTLSALRRRTHFALLRTLGVSAHVLAALLVVEAALIGIAGTFAGIVLGMLAARLGLAQAGSDLGAGFFAGVIAPIRLDALGLSAIAACGIAASVLGGLIPALEAARASPARALRAGDEQDASGGRPRLRYGIILLAAGIALALLPPIQGLPLFGYAAIACLLLGALLLMPAYAAVALRLAHLPQAAAARLAIQQLRGSPRYASISLAAILASFSLAVAMLIMIASFRGSLDHWLQDVLPADLYARAGSSASTWIDPKTQERMRAARAVSRIVFSRYDSILLDPKRPPVTLIARDLDPERPEAMQLVSAQQLPADATTPIWISEAMRDLFSMDVGQRVRLPLGGRTIDATVAGVWRDYVRQGGAVVIPRAAYVQFTRDSRANEAWIWLRPGTDASAAAGTLRTALGVGPELELREPGLIRRLSMAAFDRTFAVTYALQLAAVVIGLFGISAGASAQAIARRREFGMLHHVGMTRRQIGASLAFEGGVVGGLGAAAGLLVGAAMSLVLIHVINRQSFHWSMQWHVPLLSLIGLGIVLILCAAMTAAISARAALGDDAVRAVKEDW